MNIDVKSEVPLVEMKSPSHQDDFVVAKHGEFYWRASLETDGTQLDRDVVLACRVERLQTGFDVITSNTPGDEGFFQLSLTAGKELENLDTGMDYVFVLDTSGSMANDGKLTLSRQSLSSFIKPLGDQDRFELIAFSAAPTPLFSEVRTASEDNIQEAITFLESRRAVGGTILRSAIETAYRYRNDDRTLNVVLLSDGMTEAQSQSELIRVIQQRPSGCRVFCIGVGNEVNRPLLAQMADEAGGLAAFISQGDDFERQAQAFRRKLTRPAVSNLKLNFAGAEIYDVHPTELPNLYHGAPLRVYGRYRRSGPVNVTVQGEVQGMPFNQSVEVNLPERDEANPELQRMWAWKRVDQLLATARTSGDMATVVNEVVDLCENFSIVSEYASFIVLENDGEYRRWKIDRRNANRVGRDRQARSLLQNQLTELRNQSTAKLGPQRKSSTPAVVQNSAPAASQQGARSKPEQRPSRGFNLVMPQGGSGGGAFDPLSAAVALSLAGAAASAARKRRVSNSSQTEA
ncbi:MAG: vWA domain-containing protein [Aeoliella sp.]